MNSAPTDPLIGQILDDRYVVRSRIARGGMAMVYLGDDLRLGRRVAIKAMHPHLADDVNFTRRFEQEARSAAGLGHPNVVNVFDQGVSNGVPFLIMEYLPGITLRELLKQQRQLTPEQALEIGEAVLAGLAAAHTSGIVHRDLKPENVLLADDGRVKIGDFGLARAVTANTTTGQALLGTIAYLSPELVTRGIADERTDLYAFGIMLFEMLTGKQPYSGEQPMQIAYQHANSEVPLPSTLVPGLSPEIDGLVRWCTQRDPDDRPSDAREALDYLRALNSGHPLAATAVLPATTAHTTITPSTTVLSELEQQSLSSPAVAVAAAPSRPQQPDSREDAVTRAQRAIRRRRRRGGWIAVVVCLLLAVSAGTGLWWGHGPGSNVAVPNVAGLDMPLAQQSLEEATLVVDLFQCASSAVEAGRAARTEPEADELVERGSTVRLCQSTGPQLLVVPALAGLSLREAQGEIESGGFVFGEVVEQRFGEAPRDTVLLALDTDGNELGAELPEGATINLLLSAGPLPSVADLTPGDAGTELHRVGLAVDPALGGEAHHDTVEEGRVIRLLSPGETLSVGGSVGLEVSLGPELFPVPEFASGTTIREAVAAIEAAGFTYEVSAAAALWDFATVSRTEPAGGSMLPAGGTVTIRWQLFG